MPIPTEAFFLDRNSPLPLQLQLRRQIIGGVSEGRFRPGEKLPSSRSLAQQLGVARVTVTQAFAELVATDYLRAQDRAGYFISDSIDLALDVDDPAPGVATFSWGDHLDGRYARAQRRDRVADWRRYDFPFVYGQADPQLVDLAAWRDCAVRALGRREFAPMTSDLYGEDDPELIDYIARHILPRRGIRARPDEILLTLGAQNALWLIAQILLEQGGECAIEDPCYPGLREILSHTRATVRPVPVDPYGLPPQHIPAGLKAVFTTASHQCPTNSTMPVERRRQLLRIAQERGFAVIEDDYEFEMSFSGSASPALKAMDRAGAVIYIGSFSKSVFPGLRLGYVVADPRVIQEARALRSLVLRHPPGVLQRTLANFMSLGHYDAQLNRMRRAYADRRAIMSAAIDDHGLCRAEGGQVGGSSFWLATPAGVDSARLGHVLRDRQVLIEPGPPFFADSAKGGGFYRLAYSSIPADRIAQGVSRIALAIDAMKQA